eukprot:TRINITY_DN4919_c0_g1_i2.p1 TRINITY_DN4919_c0_g1~~TRINITY_DN4919_c0_g1_i2.p1  ORF type:complete len:300 (+),score=36.90 TRINITY_DN4919_c0_g1_i2:2-901(+)
MSLEIRPSRVDRIYRLGENVSGLIVITTKGALSHNGIQLVMQGDVNLQLSSKSVGLFEAFYNSIKPIQLIHYSIEVAKAGKIPDGVTEIPFEFKLEPAQGQTLYETYHGVYVNIQYSLTCDLFRPLLSKNIQKKLEFIVEVEQKPDNIAKPAKVQIDILPAALELKKGTADDIPKFKISGFLESGVCQISRPFTGEITIEECKAKIKSIEIQLLRVETCGCADGYAKEATEIQNIQLAEGDVCRTLAIPIYMIFPRLFTCPTIATRTFKIEFEINIVVLLENANAITENFPIRLVRLPE